MSVGSRVYMDIARSIESRAKMKIGVSRERFGGT